MGTRHAACEALRSARRRSSDAASQDEAYVVISGSGTFVYGDRRNEFKPADFLFAPAGLPHRFEDFSDNLLRGCFSTALTAAKVLTEDDRR